MAYRCIAAIPNSGGSCIQKFYEDTPEGHAEAEAFAREYDKPGMGVYDCVSPLTEPRRSKDTVHEIIGLHVDIDARHVGETKERILECVRLKLEGFGILSRMVDSGRGIHFYLTFREPIPGRTPEADRAERVLARMIEHLGADPAPKHFAALMRRLGTTNTKEGGGPCQVIADTGARCELSDIESYLDLVEASGALFIRKGANGNANGADLDLLPDGHKSENEPIDIEARLDAMRFEGGDNGVNETIPSVIAALIWRGEHPDNILARVMGALKEMAARDGIKDWDWKEEEKQTVKRITSAYSNLFEKEYDHTTGVIPVWLPMEFHQAWASILAEGRRPQMNRNGHGFHVRRFPEFGEKEAAPENTTADNTSDAPKDDAPKAPFILRPFSAFDVSAIPQREYVFGRHTISAVSSAAQSRPAAPASPAW
jgi:hypothetical protein